MAQIQKTLSAHPGVSAVAVNLSTGSVLVTGRHTDQLQQALSELLDIVVESVAGPAIEPGVESTVRLVRNADTRLRSLTNGRFSLRAIVPAAFVAVGIRQLIVEGLTLGAVPWYVLIYYGVDSFLKLYPDYAPQPAEARTVH